MSWTGYISVEYYNEIHILHFDTEYLINRIIYDDVLKADAMWCRNYMRG
jgi:hypothetical protein